MKNIKQLIKIITVFTLMTNVIRAQYQTTYKDPYGNVIGKSETRSTENKAPISMFVPDNTPWDAIIQAGAAKQDRFDRNQKLLYEIKNWIRELKQKTNDEQFISKMNSYYGNLEEIENKDLSLYGDGLTQMIDYIKEDIAAYNTRVEENNRKAEELNKPENIFKLGIDAYKINDYEGTIKHMTRLVEMGKGNKDVYYVRGMSYAAIDRQSFAFDDLKKSEELGMVSARLYFRLGWYYKGSKEFEKALSSFNKAVELEPQDSYGYYSRGELKSDMGREKESIVDYTRAIQLNPNYSMAYNNRGWAKFKLKLYQEALIDLNRSIEIDPQNWVAYDSRQETKFQLNDLKGCISDCQKAIEINPNCANSYFYLGRCYFREGNKVKACEKWRQATDLGKDDAFSYISKYCK